MHVVVVYVLVNLLTGMPMTRVHFPTQYACTNYKAELVAHAHIKDATLRCIQTQEVITNE